VIYLAIAIAEAAFWVFLVAGLAVRYLARRPRLGGLLLLGSPLADLMLLVFTGIDLHRGGTPTQAHALAAVYLGASVGFGHRLVRWADAHAAYRWNDGPRPERVPKRGPVRFRHEWAEFRRASVTWAVSCAFLLLLVVVSDESTSPDVLLGYAGVLTLVLAIWFVTGPVPATVDRIRDASRAGDCR
jgi:hypothetical protein